RLKYFAFFRVATAIGILLGSALLALIVIRSALAPPWIAAGFLISGAWAFAAAIRGMDRGVILASLGMMLMFRATAVWLGEEDVRGLVQAAARTPQAEIAMYDPAKDIWLDVALLATRIGRPIERVLAPDVLTQVLRQGGMVILSDEQATEMVPWLRDQ